MKTRNLPVTESITGNLTFDISAATDFGGKPIFADIYKIDSNDETPNAPPIWEMLNINVRDYAQNQTPIGLSFSGDNSTIYNIDVKFVPEPGTLSLLAMAGLAGAGVTAYNLSKRKR
jgi:hypothetical protein